MPMPMAMCPMAKMCSRMMEKPRSGVLLMLPGAVPIVLGIAIFLEPRIVVWLAGIFAVLLGIMLLTLARFIGRSRSPS
jgi:uncharacterized membrane protein HdeD (DUF308 family)